MFVLLYCVCAAVASAFLMIRLSLVIHWLIELCASIDTGESRMYFMLLKSATSPPLVHTNCATCDGCVYVHAIPHWSILPSRSVSCVTFRAMSIMSSSVQSPFMSVQGSLSPAFWSLVLL